MSDAARYRASPAQTDVWLADTLAGDRPASMMRLAVQAPVALSVTTVTWAARRLAARHPILGSRLVFDEDGLWVHPDSFTVTVDDLRGEEDDTRARRTVLAPGEPWHVWLCAPEPPAAQGADQVQGQGQDLGRGQGRAQGLDRELSGQELSRNQSPDRGPEQDADAATVVLAFDHAYVDGESVAVLVRDFVADCERIEAGLPLPPVVTSPDYRHYAEAMCRLDQHPDEASVAYWRTTRLESAHWGVEGAKPPRTWPTRRAHLDGAALHRLNQWARAHELTLFGAVLAASAQVVTDCVAGPTVLAVPVSQRSDARFSDTVGLCTELCPLSVERGVEPFADFAHGLFLDLLQALDQLLPLGSVRRLRSAGGGTARGQRLDSVTVTMIDALDGSADWPVRGMDDDHAGRDLAIVVVRGAEGLTVVARSGHHLFGEAPIAARIATLLASL